MNKRFSYLLPLALLALFVTPAVARAGSETYSSPGRYSFTVPNYTGTLTVTVRSASGGGGGGETALAAAMLCLPQPGGNGEDGGASSFGGLSARGGSGGLGGGNTNYPRWWPNNFVSGDGPMGGPGGAGGWLGYCIGGGESNGIGQTGQTGGNGLQIAYAYSQGALAPGTTVPITVGSGGRGGLASYANSSNWDWGSPTMAQPGSNGRNRSVSVAWNDVEPSCSVTFDQNPLDGQSTTMRWSSSGADLFYINNVGYVGASGSARVFAPGDYSGYVSGPGGTSICVARLSGPEAATHTDTADSTDGEGDTSCTNRYVCDASGRTVINACTGVPVMHCADWGALYACSAGACVVPTMDFVPFTAESNSDNNLGRTFAATGHLRVAPALVRAGTKARVYWNVSNASSCTVTGSNGDSWNSPFSGTDGTTTMPIMTHTVYRLHCVDISGAANTAIDEVRSVDIVPVFQEM